MNFDIKELKDGAVEIAVGTGATILSLHAVKKLPQKYSGWVLLGAGLLGYMIDNELVKKASIAVASVGAIAALNNLAQENGLPASTGVKGMINKVVPQLNGVGTGMGSIERMNENLLGTTRAEDLLGLDEETGDAFTSSGYESMEGMGSAM